MTEPLQMDIDTHPGYEHYECHFKGIGFREGWRGLWDHFLWLLRGLKPPLVRSDMKISLWASGVFRFSGAKLEPSDPRLRPPEDTWILLSNGNDVVDVTPRTTPEASPPADQSDSVHPR